MAILCLPASCIKAADISSYPTLMMSFTEPQRLLAALVFAATSTPFHRHFKQCTQEYGPVFSFRQGVKTIVIVRRFQVAMYIMEKEGMALADRPRSMAAGETLSGGMRVLLTPAGEQFKKMGRALHSHLQVKSVASYSPTLMKTVRQNMLDIVHAAMVLALAYGKVPPSYEDPKVQSNIDDETAYLARGMFTASSDTTASKIGVAVMAATCYPETQKKVQEELDMVIGKDRSQTFADQDILPQTMVFVLESFRWQLSPMQDIIWVCGSFIHSARKLIIV
ncbi:cytochrome P450 [Armillaria novae-zelandiae]|uniref:Cytochrome P450 n=1 Tax=Armillaria novae-zelandiae TaxID=153914 RepID=A0AA39NUK9_9AGAR|nr:cytochrome P450 [Armillaria novae-zelandiae]